MCSLIELGLLWQLAIFLGFKCGLDKLESLVGRPYMCCLLCTYVSAGSMMLINYMKGALGFVYQHYYWCARVVKLNTNKGNFAVREYLIN